MNFWTNIFTLETWGQARGRGYRVTGFPPPTKTRGGYFQSTFDAVRIGDKLACYIKAPAKRWVGVLRVESAMYVEDEDAVWGHNQDGSVKYPARFQVAPEIALDVERGLPVEATLGVLECMDPAGWSGTFRRSLTRIPPGDGEKLIELLQEPREPSPVRLPRKQVRRPRPIAVSTGESERETADPRSTTPHTELVSQLIHLGRALSCNVWVASDERGKSHDGQPFSEYTLREFPSVGLDPESASLVRSIDVLWISGKSIIAAFEVEATTSIYSGLLRMSDLVALQPNTKIELFIVAPDDRRSKVMAEIIRPTFESFDPPLRAHCKFLSASRLAECVTVAKPPVNRHLQPRVISDFAEAAQLE